MAENRCVCCGEIVPEGRQVCPTCEARASAPKYDPDEFFNRKKPSNADRIRAMSDEELAEWLEEHCFQYGWLDWLKQEVDNG